MKTKLTDNFKDDFKFVSTTIIFAIISIMILFFTSCISQKRVDKICQTCPKETIIKHDTIERTITEYVKVDPLLDSLLFVSSWNPEKETDTIYIEDSHWKGLFYISTGKLTAQINYLSDSLLMLKQSTTTSVNASEVKTIEKKVYIDKPIRDKWYYRFMFGFFGTWLIIIVGLVVWVWWQYQKGKLNWSIFKNRF
jgi:hypothetical protein